MYLSISDIPSMFTEYNIFAVRRRLCKVYRLFLLLRSSHQKLLKRLQACNFIKKETLAQVFLRFLRTPFLTEPLALVAASGYFKEVILI